VLKKAPNKYGKKGGKRHKEVIGKVKKDIDKRGFKVGTEARFDVVNEYKSKMYADVVALDGKNRIAEIHQVGKGTKKGRAIACEQKVMYAGVYART